MRSFQDLWSGAPFGVSRVQCKQQTKPCWQKSSFHKQASVCMSTAWVAFLPLGMAQGRRSVSVNVQCWSDMPDTFCLIAQCQALIANCAHCTAAKPVPVTSNRDVLLCMIPQWHLWACDKGWLPWSRNCSIVLLVIRRNTDKRCANDE